MKNINPFPVSGYQGPEFFCDRENELDQLSSWVRGGVPAVIIGIRRLGKTGLLRHLFHHLPDHRAIFVDLQGTESFNGLVEKFAEGIGRVFPEGRYKKLWQALKSLRPSIEFDPYSGLPQISFNFVRSGEAHQTMLGLFSMLDDLKEPVLVAFDEFQQILNYPEQQTEGELRSLMQEFNSLKFLFSGSQTHLLTSMFSSGSRPFFGFAQRLYLEKMDKEVYGQFIKDSFKRHGKAINGDMIGDILDWTEAHTYYTQYLCNQLFLETQKEVKKEDLNALKLKILNVSRQDFFQWRDVLSSGQWKLLVAIAKETNLYKPTSIHIQRKYNLTTPNAIQKTLRMLLNKQLINDFFDESGEKFYKLADVYMMRFIQHEIRT